MCAKASMEDFEALLKESFEIDTPEEGTVVKGKVIAIEAGQAIIDVGYKMEGRIDLKEFANPGEQPNINVGDTVEVYLDRVENARGEAQISREKGPPRGSLGPSGKSLCRRAARRWRDLRSGQGRLHGRPWRRCCVPSRFQVDVRPVRDAGPLMGMKQPFQILKMDRRRGNIVVSRRAILEESRAEQRAEVIGNLTEGQVVDGVVKNITEYGAFVDLGGVDGLLHVTDMAWRRVNHPSEILSIGETVKVQVIKINKETHRISLGMKQLQSDPWDAVEKMYAIGTVHKGRVTNITDYGAFVELEAGVEGLVHVSEMSWTKKNVHPGKIVSTSQEVDVMVLEIDSAKRRVSLGLKQTQRNPWEVFAETHPVGSPIEGEVKNITEFGLFVGLDNDIDGMVHLSDLSWDQRGEEAIQNYRKGDTVKAAVTEVDVEKERISLSIKALGDDTFTDAVDGVKRGAVITVTVTGDRRWRDRGGIQRRQVVHPPLGPGPRPCRPAPRALPGGRQRRRPRDQHRPEDPQAGPVDQGARDRRREGSRRTVWLVRFGRLAGRHPGRGAEGPQLRPPGQNLPIERKGPATRGAFSFGGQAPVFVCSNTNPAAIVLPRTTSWRSLPGADHRGDYG
jgi:small subunit ribosomal protein S1